MKLKRITALILFVFMTAGIAWDKLASKADSPYYVNLEMDAFFREIMSR